MRLTGMATSMAFTLALIGSGESRAVDGVLEINQACAVTTCFAGDGVGFPVEITSSGSYVLTSELQLPLNLTGIKVTASQVSIDLNGFTIRGNGSSAMGLGINASSQARVWVRNGTIIDVGNIGISLGDGGTVESLRVVNSGSYGIFCGANCTIIGNTVSENYSNGIFTLTGGTISSNTVNNNGNDGIRADSGTVVLGNSVRSNGGWGLFLSVDSGYGQNVLLNNTGGDVSGGVSINASNVCSSAAC